MISYMISKASSLLLLSRWRDRQCRRLAGLAERPLWLCVLLLAVLRFCPGDFAAARLDIARSS